MPLIKHLKKKKIVGSLIGVTFVAFAIAIVLPNVFADSSYYMPDVSVELDGANDSTVTISFNTPEADDIAYVRGNFDTLIGYDMENIHFTLTGMATGGDLSPAKITNNTIADGLISWSDWESNPPVHVAERGQLLSATYTVDKNTPAGDHSICLRDIWVASENSDWETINIDRICAHVTVTRSDEPAGKPKQTILFKDADENAITSVTKHYGDDPFVVNVVVTEGVVAEYHPMDGPDDEHVVVTDRGSNMVSVGVVGEVEVCARVEETENYAETTACYTAIVTKRPLDITGAVIESKTYDAMTDATVTSVSFEDKNLNFEDYTATAEFEEADAGENVVVHVSVELTEGAAANYVLNASNYNTTGTILPYHLIRERVELLGSGTYGYSPDGVEPEVMVTAPGVFGGTYTLVEGQDYEVAYSNNTNVTDNAHVTVTGKGNFTTADVPVVVDFVIEPRGINSSNLVAPNTIVEERILSEDDIDINVDGVDLVRCDYDGQTDCDYVLSITGNTGIVGDIVNVMAEGRNNYTGVAGKDIEIVAKLEQTVSFDGVTGDIDKVYGDAKFTYTATTTGDGEITYVSSNTSVATVDLHSGEVTIVGVGVADIIATTDETDDYAEASAGYRINVSKKTVTISSVTVSNKVYDGGTDATVTGAVLSDDDLLVGDGFSIDEAHFTSANVGSYDDVYVKIKLDADAYELYQFEGNARTAETTGSATIEAFTLGADNTTAVLGDTSFTYDGEAKEPTASVTVDLDGDGTKETILNAGTNYEINYGSNVNAGTATATITGKGNYTGSLPALEFTISAAPVEDVVVTAPAQTYTGEPLEPVPTVTGTVNGESVTFTTEDYYIIDHGNFISVGDYAFGVASGYNSNYYIPITNGTFTINKAESGEPEDVPSDLASEIGQTLADLGDLPEGLSWVDDSTVITAGMNYYEATYTKDDDVENYNTTTLTIPVLGFSGEYEFIKGAGQEYVIGESESALFEIDADFELFEDGGMVYVDNELVESANYEASSNSTVIDFKKDYMDGLAIGEHSLAVLFNDGGVARTTFMVTKPVAPAESDDEGEEENEDGPAAAETGMFTGASGGVVATGLTMVMIVSLASIVYVVKKKNN